MDENKIKIKKDLFRRIRTLKGNSKNRGITLIALVVTIIIIIILAGISISMLLGNEGLLNKAKYATESYSNAQQQEELDIAKYSNQINEYVSGNRDYETEINTLKAKIQQLENRGLYSTDKTAIGIWTDGSIVYRQVLNITSTTLTANAWTNVYNASSLNISSLISCTAYTSLNGGEITNAGARLDGNNIQLYAHVAWSSINKLVIEYTTKSTD